jgi:hypothetical protein
MPDYNPAKNLRQIAIALLNHENIYGRFPPQAIYDKTGKPLLSWRVAILSELGGPALQKPFNFEEPWDSDHNKRFIEQMPEVYRHPDQRTPGMTRYQAVVGKDCAFEGSEGLRLRYFLDGVSKTILLVETAHAVVVPWTKPADWEFDPASPLKGLGGMFDGDTFHAAFVDGRVESFDRLVDPEVFTSLILRNDGGPAQYRSNPAADCD